MKKILLVSPLMALLTLNSCKDSDDDVARNYNVSVKVTASDGLSLSDLTDLSVVAVNLSTSNETKAAVTNGAAALSLPTGKYDFRATGAYGGHDVNGSKSNVSITADQEVELAVGYAAANSTLIFKEVYFTGVHDYYFKDGFYEIYNNSDEVQYLDGVILGVVDEGLANGYTPSASVWVGDDGELLDRYPMTSYTMYFPGSGTEYPLQPGESVVVAAYPIDHTARALGENDEPSPVDLSKADWEIFCGPYSKTDIDVQGVPNLEYAYHTYGIEFMPSTSGQTLILAKMPDGASIADFVKEESNFSNLPGQTYIKYLMLPSDYVIDGVDIVRAPVNERFKKLLPKTDMGMTWVDGSDDGSAADAAYSGKSLRRKVVSVENGIAKFKDTNNSSVDFILGGGEPTPGIIPATIDE